MYRYGQNFLALHRGNGDRLWLLPSPSLVAIDRGVAVRLLCFPLWGMSIKFSQYLPQIYDSCAIQAESLNSCPANGGTPYNNRKSFIPNKMLIPLVNAWVVQHRTFTIDWIDRLGGYMFMSSDSITCSIAQFRS
jgi:hypothetical protein